MICKKYTTLTSFCHANNVKKNLNDPKNRLSFLYANMCTYFDFGGKYDRSHAVH